jgi:NAD(P)-dependent dehydrogenase (short-subunit alcohol dehydrogenase family)
MSPKETKPAQKQPEQPGKEQEMRPKPQTQPRFAGSGKLKDKVAIITGGDSGIGRAVSVAFANEGADICVVYLSEDNDAQETKKLVEEKGRRCILVKGDVGDENFCIQSVETAVREFGRLDILVNNAAEQHEREGIEEISAAQLEKTFRTNIFAHFFMAKAALKHMQPGSSILGTTSITAYEGNVSLIDYSSTKGAIVSFIRSLSKSVIKRGIRVNGVAPGPIWTPLIPATFSPEHVKEFGANTPMERPGEPNEVAPCLVFLASEDASYMTGQILHPNGGRFITT